MEIGYSGRVVDRVAISSLSQYCCFGFESRLSLRFVVVLVFVLLLQIYHLHNSKFYDEEKKTTLATRLCLCTRLLGHGD